MVTEERGPETARTDRNSKIVTGEVQLRHLPEFFAVVLTGRGPYSGMPEELARLKSWAEGIGVYATGSVVGIFYEKAWVTAEASRYSLCLPTSRNETELAREELARSSSDEGISVREIPRTLIAGAFYRGPAAESAPVLEKVVAWIKERPYLPAGAPREVYLATPGVLAGGLVEMEIQQPVIPRPR
ncbi:MAG: GyrI-like domain-containing protein [Thermoleophilia bacterium]